MKEVQRGFHSHFPRTEDREYNCLLTLMINLLHGAGPSQYAASHFVIGVNSTPFDLGSNSGKAPVILGQLISQKVENNSVELSMGVSHIISVCMHVCICIYLFCTCACV